MKIKTKDFEFEGEYPLCKTCSGFILPIITNSESKEGGYYLELRWKCSVCRTSIN